MLQSSWLKRKLDTDVSFERRLSMNAIGWLGHEGHKAALQYPHLHDSRVSTVVNDRAD